MTFDSIIFGYNSTNILKGIYLNIPKGIIVGLYGINGSGKSTLLKIGSGQLQEDDGNVFIHNVSYYNKSLKSRFKKIAYLSQDSFLPKDLTIQKVIETTNIPARVFYKDIIISKLLNEKISSLSGGELRYLEIRLLLELDRDFYLLDEPFSGIEPLVIERIIELLLEAKSKNKGILITDHYYRYVKEVNDVSYILNDGTCYEVNAVNIESELMKYGYKKSV